MYVIEDHPVSKKKRNFQAAAHRVFGWYRPVFNVAIVVLGTAEVIGGVYAGGSWAISKAKWDIPKAEETLIANRVIAPYPNNQVPHVPLSMAGFQENHLYRTRFDEAMWEPEGYQPKYLTDKAELDATIQQCRENPVACHPNIKAFVDMIDRVRDISDPLTRAQAINGWVNLFIEYDLDEMKTARSNLDHRSLKQALIDRKGVCDEQARLKLVVLEAIEESADDVRWVGEIVYDDKGTFTSGHAVVEIRIGDTNWIMHNQQSPNDPKNPSSARDAEWLVQQHAQLENDIAHLNLDTQHKSVITSWVMAPFFSFNSHQHALYAPYNATKLSDVSVPDAVKNGQAQVANLKDSAYAQAHHTQVYAIMRPAMEGKYPLPDDFPVPKDPENQRKPPPVTFRR